MLLFGFILLLVILILSLSMGIEFSNLSGQHRASFVIAGLKIKKIDLTAVQQENKNQSSVSEDQEYHFSMRLLKALLENTVKIFDLYSWSDLQSFWRALKMMFSNLKLKIYCFNLTISTPDPAVTGILYGSLSALGYTFYPHKNINLFVDFESKSAKVSYRVALTVRPVELIYNSVRAAGALPLRKILETYKMINELKHRFSQGASRG